MLSTKPGTLMRFRLYLERLEHEDGTPDPGTLEELKRLIRNQIIALEVAQVAESGAVEPAAD
jgi:hypothetical protein